jgi:dTDP-4-dehydrorhamnose 3,5-epimerase
MQIVPLKLAGSFRIESDRSVDVRGHFLRTYDRDLFEAHGLHRRWRNESLSYNKIRNTVRGLHFQVPPFEETKIVRVVRGAVWDVLVDLRRDSPTYGKWDALELSAKNDLAVYIPAGFAHGFKSLQDETLVAYKIDAPYNAEAASGIRWDDPDLGIDWGVKDPVMSDRDGQLQSLDGFVSPF